MIFWWQIGLLVFGALVGISGTIIRKHYDKTHDEKKSIRYEIISITGWIIVALILLSFIGTIELTKKSNHVAERIATEYKVPLEQVTLEKDIVCIAPKDNKCQTWHQRYFILNDKKDTHIASGIVDYNDTNVVIDKDN